MLLDNASLPTIHAPAQELTEDQLKEFTRRLLDGKSLTQSETKQMLKTLERADVNPEFLNQFMQMSDSDLSKLIDLNVKIAIEVIDLCVSADQSLANSFIRVSDAAQGFSANGDQNDLEFQCQPVFRQSYLRSIMLGSQKCAKINSVEVDVKRRQNEKELGKKASERWECILRYLALPSDKNMSSVSSTTRELFSAAGFTSDNDGSADLEITSAGFQFLLLSPVHQLWTYMIEYLKLESFKGRDIRPVLELLIRVILCVVRGLINPYVVSAIKAYTVVAGGGFSQTAFEISSNWTEDQTTLIMHMRELGLIFIRKRKDG
ncbi:unnamed protein product [Haemonchus placei]|uniref:General transcription factor IIH subunit 4 n=1 Tax=Haemonchus placei TaxID=6290 RepID=A0A0N4X896_HAEPC|nr:unnamed protein product [Haemonchus placei]